MELGYKTELGARSVPRDEFVRMLAAARDETDAWLECPTRTCAKDIIAQAKTDKVSSLAATAAAAAAAGTGTDDAQATTLSKTQQKKAAKKARLEAYKSGAAVPHKLTASGSDPVPTIL